MFFTRPAMQAVIRPHPFKAIGLFSLNAAFFSLSDRLPHTAIKSTENRFFTPFEVQHVLMESQRCWRVRQPSLTAAYLHIFPIPLTSAIKRRVPQRLEFLLRTN